jgi:hypothetical protein
MSPQEREAFARMAKDLPTDELQALLQALQAAVPDINGNVDWLAALRDCLARLGHDPASAEALLAKVSREKPSNWREALN